MLQAVSSDTKPGRKLRIVHCFRSPVGGIFRHVRDLTRAQVAAGHEVGIVCDSSTGGAFEEQLFAQMQDLLALGVRRTPMQRHVGLGDASAAFRTFSVIKELRPDVLHGHGAKGGVYSRVFGSLFRVSRSRVARIYSPHGGSLHYDETSLTGRMLFRLEAALERLTDQLLFVSEHEYRTYVRKVGRPSCALCVIYNGLHDAEFEPVTEAADASDFLYVGMMRDLKGIDLFIEALAQVASATGRMVSATVVGDGADLARYRRQAASHADISVNFLSAMPAREAFALGRIMVVPSRAEAMPYIVIEGMAAGKTLVATKVGGIPEILGAESAALAQPTVASLAERMGLALRDPNALRPAPPVLDAIRQRFSARTMAEKVGETYLAALGARVS